MTYGWVDRIKEYKEETQVSVEQSAAQKVLTDLASRGYHTSYNGPNEVTRVGTSEFVSICRRIGKPQGGLSRRLLGVHAKAEELAILFTRDREIRGATDDGGWVMEVYGRSNLEEMTRFAESLSEKYGLPVEVRLESEGARRKDSDFGF